MHSCLGVNEIVAIICSFLERKALYRLALTCRHFKQLALRTLWEELRSLVPLFQLLPKDCVSKVHRACGRGVPGHVFLRRLPKFKLNRPFTAEDWSAVETYGPYVRGLHTGFKPEHYRVVLNSAAPVFKGTYLLPNLRNLYLHGCVDGYIPLAKILFCPSLTQLEIWTRGEEDAVTLLSQLGNICPSMASFTCKYGGGNDRALSNLYGCLSQAVLGWNGLKELNVPSLTRSAINHLSHLANLHSLILEHGFASDNVSFCTGFSSIRSLYTSKSPFAFLLDFMRAVQSSELDYVGVSLPKHDKTTPAQWKEFCYLLAQCSSAAENLGLSVDNDEPVIADADVLWPLLAARNLTMLDLSNCYLSNLEDDFVEELTKASPNLFVLRIGIDQFTDNDPTLTLKSYLHVFRYCPLLSRLGLVVDTSTAHECLGEIPDEGQIKLRGDRFELQVGESEVGNAAEVAAFLSAFFFEPIGILGYTDAGNIYNEGWEQVENMIPIFINVRMQERKFKWHPK